MQARKYKITQSGSKGFNSVTFTEDNSKAKIILKLENTSANRQFLEWIKTNDYRFYKSMVIKEENKKIYCTVTGNHQVIEVLELFKLGPYYSNNYELLNYIEKYLKEIRNKDKVLNKKPLMSTYIDKYEFKKNMEAESHTISKSIQTKSTEQVVYKKIKLPYENEVEVFAALCFQLLLGIERHPKVQLAYDENNKSIGLISEYIDAIEIRLLTVSDYELIQILLEGGAARVWVAAYLLKDSDLHPGNYYLNNKTKKIGKWDDDSATYEISCEYKRKDPEHLVLQVS